MLIFRFKVHFKHYYGCHSRGHFSHCYCGFSPTNICQDVRFFDWICTKYGAIHKWRHQFFLTLWSFPLQCHYLFTSVHHNFFPQFFTPFPLKIGDVIYGKPLCVEWVLFIASSRFIHRGIHNWHNFFANFDPLTPVQIIVANYR